MSKYYVTMTDKFMSGWGMASGKINKLIFVCESYEEARIIENNAIDRGDQKYINITTKKPYYNASRYYAQYKNKEEYETWYIKDSFKE